MKKLLAAAVLSLGLIGTASAGTIEAFAPTDLDGINDDAGVLLAFEYGEWLTTNGISYGWYFTDTGDNSIVDTLDIFDGSDGILAGSTVSWDYGSQTATSSNGGDTITWAGLQSDWELGAFFGYNGQKIYSHDSLNAGNADLVNITEIDWAGFDLSFSFQDTGEVCGLFCKWGLTQPHEKPFGQLVKVSDVTPWDDSIGTFGDPTDVPEPGTIALFGLALAGMASASRKKKVAKV